LNQVIDPTQLNRLRWLASLRVNRLRGLIFRFQISIGCLEPTPTPDCLGAGGARLILSLSRILRKSKNGFHVLKKFYRKILRKKFSQVQTWRKGECGPLFERRFNVTLAGLAL
jgi:hypothetical protein